MTLRKLVKGNNLEWLGSDRVEDGHEAHPTIRFMGSAVHWK
jgi:hypothetical protein